MNMDDFGEHQLSEENTQLFDKLFFWPVVIIDVVVLWVCAAVFLWDVL